MAAFINALGLLVGAYVLVFICSAIYYLYFHALAHFPGPALWVVSRIPWAYHTIKGDLFQVLHNLHEQYGPTVRIAPDELATINPAAWKDVYTTKPLLPKDPHSQTQPLNGAHSLFTAEGDTHRRIRAALSNTFSEKALRAQALIIEKYADQLVARVQRESHQEPEGTHKVDLTKLYGYAAFDTITDLSLGEPLSPGLDGLNEHGWVQGYFFHAKFSAIRIALSRFSPMDKVLGIFLLGVTRKARERNWRIISAAFKRRMARAASAEKEPERVDLLTPLMDRVDENGQKGVTKAELFTNGLAFVIAGTQLNTNVVSTATYLLLQHRTAWQRLSQEVLTQFSSDNEITVQSTQGLTYLEAVIKETLRIRHPTPINLPRVIPPTGCSIDGTFIPGNVVVGINVQNIQNATSLWVEPRKFHPERFLDTSSAYYDSRFDADVKEAFAPFSVGPRNCIGYKVFFAQVRVLLAKMVWNFDLRPLNTSGEDWMEQKAWFAFEPRPLIVEVTPRSNQQK